MSGLFVIKPLVWEKPEKLLANHEEYFFSNSLLGKYAVWKFQGNARWYFKVPCHWDSGNVRMTFEEGVAACNADLVNRLGKHLDKVDKLRALCILNGIPPELVKEGPQGGRGCCEIIGGGSGSGNSTSENPVKLTQGSGGPTPQVPFELEAVQQTVEEMKSQPWWQDPRWMS